MAQTAPTPAPPNFYDNMAAMGGPAGAAKPAAKKVDESELFDAFKGIFKVLGKMEKAEPKLVDKFAPIRQQLKSTVMEVLNIDPNKLDAEETPAPGPVEGNASPQGIPEATPPPPEAEKVPA